MRRSCSNCKSENLKSMGEIKIDLPTPTSELVFGGRSPQYHVNVKLPFVFCGECGVVMRA